MHIESNQIDIFQRHLSIISQHLLYVIILQKWPIVKHLRSFKHVF